VVEAYLDLMETARGVVRAVVTTAEPLKPKTLEGIKTAVTAIAGEGKKVLSTLLKQYRYYYYYILHPYFFYYLFLYLF